MWRHGRRTRAWSRQSTPTRRAHSGLVGGSRSSLSASSLSQSEGIQSASAAEYQARAAAASPTQSIALHYSSAEVGGRSRRKGELDFFFSRSPSKLFFFFPALADALTPPGK